MSDYDIIEFLMLSLTDSILRGAYGGAISSAHSLGGGTEEPCVIDLGNESLKATRLSLVFSVLPQHSDPWIKARNLCFRGAKAPLTT